MSEPPVRCRIPLAWQMQLETIACHSGQSLEQVIYQAIGRYLGQFEPGTGLNAGLNSRQPPQTANTTADTGAILAQMMTQMNTLAARVTVLEQGRSSLPILPIEEIDEEIEDEPDEILNSFLETEEFQERVRALVLPFTYEDIENEPDEILYDFLEP